MSREWIESRHGYRLSKDDGTRTQVLCTVHNQWHAQKVRLGKRLVDGHCHVCRQEYSDLHAAAYALGIRPQLATKPWNLKRIEARLGKQLLRYHHHA